MQVEDLSSVTNIDVMYNIITANSKPSLARLSRCPSLAARDIYFVYSHRATILPRTRLISYCDQISLHRIMGCRAHFRERVLIDK